MPDHFFSTLHFSTHPRPGAVTMSVVRSGSGWMSLTVDLSPEEARELARRLDEAAQEAQEIHLGST